MTADLISIKINSWKKHNGRSDVMKNSWFKLNNRIFEDPIMYSLPPEHFKTWIFLLCVASQTSNAQILINLELAEKILCVKKSEMLSCIRYLASQKIIDVTQTVRGRNVDVPAELELELEKKYSSRRYVDVPPNTDAAHQESVSLVQIWNSKCGSLAKVRMLTPKRTKLIKQLSNKISLEEWGQVVEKVATNPFLTGNNKQKWRADFDWVLKDEHWVKVLEGSYGSSKNNDPGDRW